MGFLDHSTNNIILDAVLTDTGRELLSRNDGSFSIEKFALGDDEVNYNTIKKYGRTVGKEKIEKNTPVFEALTDQSQSQKYKLVSNSNPNLVKMPNFLITGDAQAFSGGVFTIFTTGTLGKPSQATVTVTQNVLNETTISVEFQDTQYIVDVPHLFVRLNGNIPPNSIDKMQRAQYIGGSTSNNSNGGTSLQFILAAKPISSQVFDVYGSGSSAKDTIKSYIRVTGLNSGAVKDIPIYVKRAATS